MRPKATKPLVRFPGNPFPAWYLTRPWQSQWIPLTRMIGSSGWFSLTGLMSAASRSGEAWPGLIGNTYTINLYCSWKLKPAKLGWGCGLTETQCRLGFTAMEGRDFPNLTPIPAPPQRLPHPLDFLVETNAPAKRWPRVPRPNII